MTSIKQDSIVLTPTRQDVVRAMRRVLWLHGIVTVDLNDNQTYDVVQTAAAMMRHLGYRFEDWDAWYRFTNLARHTVVCHD